MPKSRIARSETTASDAVTAQSVPLYVDKQGGKQIPITFDDVKSGKRVRVSRRELSQLSGYSVAKFEKEACEGKGLPFQKDLSGRVWYRAADVIAFLEGKVFRSTSEYDTSSHIERLTNARAALRENRA